MAATYTPPAIAPGQSLTDGQNIVIGYEEGALATIGYFTGALSFVPALSAWGNEVIPAGATLVDFTAHPTLTTISIATSALTSLVSVGPGGSLANLTAVTIAPGGSGPAPLQVVIIVQAALTQASVDGLIAACVAGGYFGGFLTVNDGTSAAPSVASAANLVTLASRSWTVTTN